MKKIFFLTVLLTGAVSLVYAQSYRVYFTDKGSSTSLLHDPYQYLSPQAIEKKSARGVVLDKSDLPVAAEYLQALKEAGLEVQMSSRWFNYAKVSGLTNPEEIQQLDFVRKIEKVESYQVSFSGETQAAADTLIYGIAANQIEMLNGDYLHNRGLQGQGMSIAVFDGGFRGARNLNGLDSLWNSGRVKDIFNFVDGDTNIFQDGDHGTSVLSVMAGFIDSVYAGSAILADYYLYKTEFQASETTSEMDNWVRAAERSDSIGIDVITTSLGYNKFDGGFGDYDYEDMDGNTTLITRAADKASGKGMLVIASAGNEGNDPWKFITAPADGDSVMAVGAVLPDGSYASFSSQGPTFDGRIKPDVMAQGVATALLNSAGPSFGNGTSFACPIISGLAACLWQTDPSLSNWQIFEAIRSNASQVFTPDYRLGFGIANFREASWEVGKSELPLSQWQISLYPNPVGEQFSLEISGLQKTTDLEIAIFDLAGNLLLQQQMRMENNVSAQIEAPGQKGAYLLSISTGSEVYLKKFVR